MSIRRLMFIVVSRRRSPSIVNWAIWSDLLQVGVGQVLHLLGVGDAGRFADLAGARAADAENRGQGGLGVLGRGDVYRSNTCHVGPLNACISLDAACAADRCRSRGPRPCGG